MLEFEGRHAVTSSTGKRVLLGAFEKSVAIVDLLTGARSKILETTFDFGGDRLALSDSVNGVLAAAYHVHGLALYCGETGREKWRRRDIKKVQHVSLSRDGLTAFCGREGASLVVVDLESGDTKRTIRGARAFYESGFDPVQFLDCVRPQLIDLNGSRIFRVVRTTFGFLDVAFAPEALVLSESGGPVRCIETTSGREQWRFQPKPGRHVLHLGYRAAERSILGVEWPFEKGGAKRLIRWAVDNGQVIDSLILGEPSDCCFGLAGEVIVLADGKILATTPTATGSHQ